MIPSGAKLEEIGRALYGENWQSKLAEKLGRTRQTIHNWRHTSPPQQIVGELLRLVEDQIAELGVHYESLREAVEP